MARKKKADIQRAARARAGRHPNQLELNQRTSASAEESVTSNENTPPPSPSRYYSSWWTVISFYGNSRDYTPICRAMKKKSPVFDLSVIPLTVLFYI